MTESEYRLVKAFCLSILSIGVFLLIGEAMYLTRQLRSDSHEVTLKLDAYIGAAQYPTQNALAQIAAVGKVAAQIEAKERNDFDAQQAYYKSLTGKSSDLVDAVTLAARRINDRILPDADVVLQNTGRAVSDLATTADRLGDHGDAALDKVTTLTGALTLRVADPRYDSILADAAESMRNIKSMTADTHAITTDAAAFVHRELAPARGVKNTLRAALDVAYKIKLLIF